MARMQISEYGELGHVRSSKGDIAAPQEPRLAAQEVAIGGGSVQSAAFNENTRFIRVNVDAICSFRFGLDPTAVATEGRMGAGATEFFGVVPGNKVAVIQNT